MSMGKIIDNVYGAGFKLNRLKMSRFNNSSCDEFYKEHVGKDFYGNLSGHMKSDVAIGMELVSDDAVKKWRSVIGPTNT